MQILIKHGRVLDPESGTDQVTDILIEDGKVTRIGDDLQFPAPYRREVFMEVGGDGDVTSDESTLIGKKVGTKLTGKASVLGGIILIAIGIEIFVGGI